MTIPDHYRQWAKKEAEREYPIIPAGLIELGTADARVIQEGRRAYEAALLRLWPVVEALRHVQHDEDCGKNASMGSYLFAKGCTCGLDDNLEALSSPSLPPVQ